MMWLVFPSFPHLPHSENRPCQPASVGFHVICPHSPLREARTRIHRSAGETGRLGEEERLTDLSPPVSSSPSLCFTSPDAPLDCSTGLARGYSPRQRGTSASCPARHLSPCRKPSSAHRSASSHRE